VAHAGQSVRLLATTNRGFESVSADEIAELTGASPETERPGLLGFDGDGDALARLHCRARTLNRILVELVRAPLETLADTYDHTHALPLAEYLAPDQPIAVRATRIGEHEFTSMDVAERVGQAIVDGVRDATGERIPVDLDDPEVVFRAFVREDRFRLAIDATGQTSLHRRPYRVHQHDAPVRPTMAAALCRLADLGPDTAVHDPMCGCGTVPIEAALAARNLPPAGDRALALEGLVFVDSDALRRERAAMEPRPVTASIRGSDVDDEWVDAARENAREAGVDDDVTFEQADAAAVDVDTDAVVVDMPFGVRTEQEGIGTVYKEFFANLRTGSWDRLVVLTARDDLVPFEPSRRLEVRHGRLEVAVLVVERDDVEW
jgi:23S rRNA G2445 N2-methylase RlmL